MPWPRKRLTLLVCPLVALLFLFHIIRTYTYIFSPAAYSHRLLTHSDLDHPVPAPNASYHLHYTWKTHDIPDRWVSAYESCKALVEKEGGWTLKVWSDDEGRELVKTEYPMYLRMFDSYPYTIQRADAVRYFILHHYGGVYLDLDVGCRGPSLKSLLIHPVTLPQTEPVGFSNDVLAASHPRHPFFEDVIRALSSHNHYYGTKYPTVFFSTGPMFMSLVYGTSPWQNEVWILPNKLYGNEAKSLFKHYRGDSWHGWDAAVVFWLWKHIWAVVAGGIVGVAGLGFACWKCCWMRRGRKKRPELED
ncbi:hypothetical protein HK104_010268 [Borealophlyctis nickersoniae]|nr:hypothetical protein HK104_010268 [Borealophlyctis nickersoniae]